MITLVQHLLLIAAPAAPLVLAGLRTEVLGGILQQDRFASGLMGHCPDCPSGLQAKKILESLKTWEGQWVHLNSLSWQPG